MPFLVWFPLTLAGLGMMASRREILGTGLVLLIAANILGWLTLNRFGQWENRQMRGELAKILNADHDLPADRVFVGFATPKYSGLVDAHEDVGFLCFKPDALLFVSETRTVEVPKSSTQSVRYRANAHTILGVGRWVSVECVQAGQALRLLVEPRERSTMLGNLRASRALREKIERWRAA